MYKFLLPLFFSAPFISISQGKLHGTVWSFNRKQPIPYVNIVPVGRQGGTYSDETGAFEITARDKDSLVFSSVGYNRITLCVADIKKMSNQVQLYPESIPLEFVTIGTNREAKIERENFGYLKTNGHQSNVAPGSQYAVFIKNDSGQEGLIESLLLGISADRKSRIRIRVYEHVNGNAVGKEITKQNIFADVTGNHPSFKIDISMHHILFPEKGVVVAVEFIGVVDRDVKINRESSVQTKLYVTDGNDTERNTWVCNRDRRFVRESFTNQLQINVNAVLGLSVVFFEEIEHPDAATRSRTPAPVRLAVPHNSLPYTRRGR